MSSSVLITPSPADILIEGKPEHDKHSCSYGKNFLPFLFIASVVLNSTPLWSGGEPREVLGNSVGGVNCGLLSRSSSVSLMLTSYTNFSS